MEFYINLQNTDDATDLFLLAKEQLLDVNDWANLTGNTYSTLLLDSKKQKLHRNARVGDVISITNLFTARNIWIEICNIQYDYFPDIDSESISILLCTSGQSFQQETIIIKRDKSVVTAHCNAGNEMPTYDSLTPEEHINNHIDKHPVLNIPEIHLQQLLRGMIKAHIHAA